MSYRTWEEVRCVECAIIDDAACKGLEHAAACVERAEEPQRSALQRRSEEDEKGGWGMQVTRGEETVREELRVVAEQRHGWCSQALDETTTHASTHKCLVPPSFPPSSLRLMHLQRRRVHQKCDVAAWTRAAAVGAATAGGGGKAPQSRTLRPYACVCGFNERERLERRAAAT